MNRNFKKEYLIHTAIVILSSSVILLADLGNVFDPLNLKMYDTLFYLKSKIATVQPSSRIVMVEIDDKTFDDKDFGIPMILWHNYFAVINSRTVLFQALKQIAQDEPGTVTFPDGSRYAGPLKDGLPHGQGRMFFADYEYAGPFRKGVFHGHGAIILPDGTKKYEGQFSKGLPHGQGIRRSSDGRIYENMKIYLGIGLTHLNLFS